MEIKYWQRLTNLTRSSEILKGNCGKVLVIIASAVFFVCLFSYKLKAFHERKFRFGKLSNASLQPVRDGKNIFFLETRTNPNHIANLTKRQACAIESAAIANPERNVFFLFMYEVNGVSESSKAVTNAALSYKNVHAYQTTPTEFAKDTIIEKFMNEGKVLKSHHLIHHLSDILRILTLWKYSGTYFDLDVVEKLPVSERGNNFACTQRDGMVVSGIVNLHGDLGRRIAEENLKIVINNFNGESWMGNGPIILSDIIKKTCGTNDINRMRRRNCKGFEVLPAEDCYGIDFHEWEKLFEPKHFEESRQSTEGAFVVHFWNYLTAKKILKTNSDAFYVKLAKQYCPKVFKASGDEF